MSDFTHLHVHTVYSLLDGECRIKDLVDYARTLNQKALAITDHGSMYGVIEFYKEAKKAGIKPIIGVEVYIASRGMRDKSYELDAKRYHLILLAENDKGYQNLVKIVSLGHTEGFYFKPRVDREVLRQYSEGIIALSACVIGEIPQAILAGNISRARELIEEYLDIYGKDNFFLEVQNHGSEDEIRVNHQLSILAQEYNVGLVATNDVHYIEKDHAEYQDILMCIQSGKTLDDPERLKFVGSEYYLKSVDEMTELFNSMPEAIENTQKIAMRCNVNIEFGIPKLPEFAPPEGKESLTYLKELCYQGAIERYGQLDRVKERLDYELATIANMGFVDYFLIVWDFISYAKNNDITVGPGRGSAAGSIVAYCLRITDIDPIRFNLLFERFLNPERVSMPDIDIDFCYRRRGEVIKYVVQKYGKGNVAQIITFGTLAARAAIRDVGRVMGVAYADVDYTAKQIPFAIGMTIEKALEINTKLKQAYDNNMLIKRLLDVSMAVQGVPRHASTHAAGIVITKDAVSEYVPTQLADDNIITQFTMGTLEELGLLKMDFLGLRNLTIIKDTLDLVGSLKLEDIPQDDPQTFALIANGNTDGVFQLESLGMKSFMRELKPQNIEDIIAGISLYRPGPMESIPKYIKNKNHPELVTYKDPRLEKILDVTYGCVVYQEQVMQLVRDLGGFSLGRADLLRRAMSKKKQDVMQQERHNFIYGKTAEDGTVEVEGAIRRGVPEQVAQEIFDEIADFCKYAFNKSHAAAYAQIAYQTAYLKAHYPVEFMAALLSADLDNTSRVTKYIAEAKRMNIKLLPPDINHSEVGFTAEGGDSIRFGMAAVKNVGYNTIVDIIEERNAKGIFTSFYDFCVRTSQKDLNKKAAEALISCGAFDAFAKRAQLFAVYEKTLDDVSGRKRTVLSGQMSLFEDRPNIAADELPNIPEFSKERLLIMERECMGIFVSGNPLDDYRHLLEVPGTLRISDILSEEEADGESRDGKSITVIGIITRIKKKTTKSNAEMAFVTIEDLTGELEVILFPRILEENDTIIAKDNIVKFSGRLNCKEEEVPKLIGERLEKLDKNIADKPKKIYIKISAGHEDKISSLQKLLHIFSGDTPVLIYYESTKQTMSAPRDLWVRYNEMLDKEIRKLFGEECDIRVK